MRLLNNFQWMTLTWMLCLRRCKLKQTILWTTSKCMITIFSFKTKKLCSKSSIKFHLRMDQTRRLESFKILKLCKRFRDKTLRRIKPIKLQILTLKLEEWWSKTVEIKARQEIKEIETTETDQGMDRKSISNKTFKFLTRIQEHMEPIYNKIHMSMLFIIHWPQRETLLIAINSISKTIKVKIKKTQKLLRILSLCHLTNHQMPRDLPRLKMLTKSRFWRSNNSFFNSNTRSNSSKTKEVEDILHSNRIRLIQTLSRISINLLNLDPLLLEELDKVNCHYQMEVQELDLVQEQRVNPTQISLATIKSCHQTQPIRAHTTDKGAKVSNQQEDPRELNQAAIISKVATLNTSIWANHRE